MKKIVLSLISILIFLTGCSSDTDYAETVNELSYLESEFYPSGRIKSISDGPEEMTYQDIAINFNDLKSEIKKLRENTSEAKTNNDIKEELSWQIADLDIKLRGLKLSKNLTSKEKKDLTEISKELKDIQTKAQKIWDN